ncbi:TPA: hypothetical protein ACH3X2_013315 [Trebouxia sp. C0005]
MQATVVHGILGRLCQIQALPDIEIYMQTQGSFCLNLSLLQSHLAVRCKVVHIGLLTTPQQLLGLAALSNVTSLSLTLTPPPAEPSGGHDLLLKHLANMRQLEDLTLENLAALPYATSILSSLAKLKGLHITASTAVTYDFQPCTQLTFLSFSHQCWQQPVVLLPTSAVGGDASLANLKLSSICNVHNLEFALQLTCLGMSSASLQNSIIQWPYRLPQLVEFWDLEIMELGDDAVYALPAEWGCYTNLLRLCLRNLHVDELPTWFSNLQRLQELEMNYARFLAFPASLSQLSALERLEMRNLHAYFSENVVDLAALPKLTSLACGEMLPEPDPAYDPDQLYKVLSDEEMQHLKQLELACLVRKLPLGR